jgi:hypothetical protein
MAKSKKTHRSVVYRDKKTGRLVSQSTWKRSKARGGTRYVRQTVKTRRTRGRRIFVLGFDGYVPVVVRSSKQRQLASRHLNAVGRFLRPPGDAEVLKPFVGKRVGGVELLTDPERLRELGEAEEIKLDAFYRQHRGARQEK